MKQLRKSADRDGITSTDVDELVSIVGKAADRAGPLLERIPVTFKQYTDHNLAHSRNLIDWMGRFIPVATRKKLNGLELALLMLTALLHDLGMFVTEEEKGAFLESPEFDEFLLETPERLNAMNAARQQGKVGRVRAIEDAALADYFRRRHPERARQNLERHLSDVLRFGDVDLIDLVSRLAESHGWGVFESIDYKRPNAAVAKEFSATDPVNGIPVNPRYIACCLRLADIMDFDRSRTPLTIWETIDFTEARSQAEWLKHLQITGWTVTPRDVRYHAKCTHTEHYVAVSDFLDLIDRELDECSRLIAQEPAEISKRYQLDLHRQVDRSHVRMANPRYLAGAFRFELDYERIMTVLMDRSLYPDPSLCLRELLQNSLDACRNRAALAEASSGLSYEPRILIRDLTADAADRRVIVEDNGIGMSLTIVKRYFMRIGQSYYRSPEFQAERQKLEKKGVSLEATSRFGIGFLSTFMLADRIEVETLREGSTPLRISMDGPTKYFLVEELDAGSLPVGTRVTLHLKDGASVDPAKVMRTFAVNVDTNIVVVDGNEHEIARIEAFAWEGEGPDTSTQEWLASSADRPLAMPPADLVAPIDIPLHLEQSQLRGRAWHWLLLDTQGRPVPRRGLLRCEDGFITAIPPNDLVELIDANVYSGVSPLAAVFEDSPADQLERALIEYFADGASGSADERAEELAEAWNALSEEERVPALRWIRSAKDGSRVRWFEDEDAWRRMANGGSSWAERPLRFRDAIHVNGPDVIALHGILLPGGVTDWLPMEGESFSEEVRIDQSCGVRIDCRGSSTPVPAANRLFIASEELPKFMMPYLRAYIRHLASLIVQGDRTDWRRWLNSLNRLYQLEGLPMVAYEEHDLIAKSIGYYTPDDKVATREQLIAHGVQWLPIGEARWGVSPNANLLVCAAHPLRVVGVVIEAKIDEIVEPRAATFRELLDQARTESETRVSG
jgi:hypothetical protein